MASTANGNPLFAKWRELCVATLLELPLATAHLILSGGLQNGIEAAAWHAYESCLCLANETANFFYGTSWPQIHAGTGDVKLGCSGVNARIVRFILDSWPHTDGFEVRSAPGSGKLAG
jgi:hypothetical protein